MLRRYNRLLVALYIASDALLRLHRLPARLRPALRPALDSDYEEVTRPSCEYLTIAPFVGLLVPVVVSPAGRVSPASRPDARRRFLRRARGIDHHGGDRRHRHALYPDLTTCLRLRKTSATSKCSQVVWALFLGLNLIFHTRRAKPSASCCGAGGAPASASSASSSRVPAICTAAPSPIGSSIIRSWAFNSPASSTTAPRRPTRLAIAAYRCSVYSAICRRSVVRSGLTRSMSRCRSTSTSRCSRSSRPLRASASRSTSCRTSCNSSRSAPASKISTACRSSASTTCRCAVSTAWPSA